VSGIGEWIALAAGLLIVGGASASVIKTLIVPRGVSSRITEMVTRMTVTSTHLVADRFGNWERRDRILAALGPALLLSLLAVWLGLFLVGYALMLWPLSNGSFGDALRLSGSSMFTLGIASVQDAAPTTLVFLAAATGLIIVAVQIAYLPALYAAFNRRETLVTLLESRGGAPIWGPEVLARHELVDIVDNLKDLYGEWERWAADLAETHTNYPVLIYFRSPHPLRSWILALLAIADAAALQRAINPFTSPSETRLVLRMSATALRDIAGSMRIPFAADPSPEDPINLTEGEFRDAVRHVKEAGWHLETTVEEAWLHFRGWRVNYEAIAYAIADAIEAPPAPWSGPRGHLPGLVIPPVRPVDRRPKWRQELRTEADRRRIGRPASGYVPRRHVADPVAEVESPSIEVPSAN
jgi:uncharacterized membrane protein